MLRVALVAFAIAVITLVLIPAQWLSVVLRLPTRRAIPVALSGLQGIPMGRQHRPVAAWYGALDLMPHLGRIIAEGALDVTVTWGEPIAFDGAADRKAVTRALEDKVRHITAQALRGVKVAL